jgi:DNA (cytosine-5)-methyltransferase 1
MTLKVFTAFSGYDSQCMALDRMKINYELVGWSEIDKYAIMTHNAIYPQYKDRNFGDISKIDWENVPDFDLFTYSFPCTDISSAGQQKGLEEGSGTRSGLLWECKKAIELKRPKYLLMENVKALTQKKFLPYLHKWHSFLTEMGYTNFTQILNSKNFGVPQNRERVFMVSILGDAWFDFPKPFQSDKKLKDLLDENVDYRYYGNLQGKSSVKEEKIHPTQKPIILYEWLLQNFAKSGQKILDTHGGSMSHAIAAHKLGFDLTIIEKDPVYYEQAKKRLIEFQRQQVLF